MLQYIKNKYDEIIKMQSNPLSAFNKALDYFEETLKTLSFVMISAYIKNSMPDTKINKTLEKLAVPSLGDFNNFLNTLIKWADREENIIDKSIIDKIKDFNNKKIEDESLIAIFNEFSNDLDNKTVNVKSIPFRSIVDMIIRTSRLLF